MKGINFVTNIKLENQSGGWDGANFRVYNEISKNFQVKLTEGLNPSVSLNEKIISKARRLLGLKGSFFFFSDSRLSLISRLIDDQIDKNADIDFFWGATPWVDCQPKRPYAVYLDATFKTYLNIYLEPSEFIYSDIERICDKESRFLKQAKWVFWGSTWALEEAAGQYHFDFKEKKKHLVVNTGGNLPIPDTIAQDPAKNLVLIFISLNFEKKGGLICYEAFKRLKMKFPNIKLKIIGEQPPRHILLDKDVVYIGYLKKDKPDHVHLFVETLKSASFLVHPTKMDTIGAVIIEAGFYGCPSIAPKMFGIPDLIENGRTGFLIEKNDPEAIEMIISRSFNDSLSYLEMREECFDFFTRNLTWGAIGEKISNFIYSDYQQ